ncbi:epimerase, partial [Candidatus Roizmanbacteria bacterium CG10_big_fil_rev_8_21_14_0_10_39_6]
GSGNNRYQLLEVDDLVTAINCALNSRSKKVNSAFNIGAEVYGTVKSDLEALFGYAKSGSTIFPVPSVFVKTPLRILEALHLSPLYRWVYDTADKDSFVSIEKAKKILGWKPKYSNAQALIRSYNWYKKHYKNIKSKRAGFTHTVGWKQGALGIVKRLM